MTNFFRGPLGLLIRYRTYIDLEDKNRFYIKCVYQYNHQYNRQWYYRITIVMKKVVSFSIYGNVPCYQVGAIMNIVEVARLLPDWKCRFYTTDSCTFCNQLEYLGAEVVRMNNWPFGF